MQSIKLKDLIRLLSQFYCGKIGYQYYHITNSEQRCWMRNNIEQKLQKEVPRDNMVKIAKRLCKEFVFGNFLKDHFPNQKLFDAEGLESFISGLGAVVDECFHARYSHIVIGMADQGRIGTLHNILKKKPEDIFSQCRLQEAGDKSEFVLQKGYSIDKKYPNGHNINIVRSFACLHHDCRL